jgi:hypothetical protein
MSESAMDETFPLSLTDITATLGTDYTGTPTFTNGVTYDDVTGDTVPAGATYALISRSQVQEDFNQEADETFTLAIGATATGTITNDDDATVVAMAPTLRKEMILSYGRYMRV